MHVHSNACNFFFSVFELVWNFIVAYVIVHVVEKDNIQENDKNGRKTKVIDAKLEDIE